MAFAAKLRSRPLGTSRSRPRNQAGCSRTSTPKTAVAAIGIFIAATSSPNDCPCVMRPAKGMKSRITTNRPTSPSRRSTTSVVVHSTGLRVSRMVS